MKLYMDVGGTTVRCAFYEAGSETLYEEYSTNEQGLYALITRLIKRFEKISFIGIAYAGQVHQGRILSAPNIVVDEAALQEKVMEAFKIPLQIENDLNCAVLAEARACGSDEVVALYVGTGLGCGVVTGGSVLKGASSLAGELGHIPYRESPFLCGCGKSNCIELYGSGSALQRWKDHLKLKGDATLGSLRANAEAQTLVQDFEDALLYACATAVTLYNPSRLVLGGGVIEKNLELVEMVQKRLVTVALPVAAEMCTVEMSSIHNAPLLGAQYLEESI